MSRAASHQSCLLPTLCTNKIILITYQDLGSRSLKLLSTAPWIMEVYTTTTPAHKTETSFQTLSSVAGAERIKPNADSDKEWQYAHPQGSAVWIIPACVIIAAIVAKIAMSKFYNSHYLCIETFKGNIKNCVKSILARLYAPGKCMSSSSLYLQSSRMIRCLQNISDAIYTQFSC